MGLLEIVALFRFLKIVLVGLLPVVDGLALQKLGLSTHKELVAELSLAPVSAFETVLIQLPQKGSKLGLLKVVFLEDLDDGLFAGRASGTTDVDLEGLAIGHPGDDIIVTLFFRILQHVIQSLGKDGNSLLFQVAILALGVRSSLLLEVCLAWVLDHLVVLECGCRLCVVYLV